MVWHRLYCSVMGSGEQCLGRFAVARAHGYNVGEETAQLAVLSCRCCHLRSGAQGFCTLLAQALSCDSVLLRAWVGAAHVAALLPLCKADYCGMQMTTQFRCLPCKQCMTSIWAGIGGAAALPTHSVGCSRSMLGILLPPSLWLWFGGPPAEVRRAAMATFEANQWVCHRSWAMLHLLVSVHTQLHIKG